MKSVPTKLRVVAWNCNMAFHNKFDQLITHLQPDIAILSECARPDMLLKKGVQIPSDQIAWIGENINKGLAVIAFGPYRISVASVSDLKWILPVEVGGPIQFTLVGVWARHKGIKNRKTPGPVETFLARYDETTAATLIAGDFNSSLEFNSEGKHQRVLAHFDRLKIISAYHSHFNEKQGEESRKTIYWRKRNIDGRKYHIDYCFLPTAAKLRVTNVSVGEPAKWLDYSDHMPLVVDLETSGPRARN